MVWALVKDNVIENIGYLPKQYNGIPEEQLTQYGWYRVVDDTTQVYPWQTSQSNYSFDGTNVIETKTITGLTMDEWKDKKYSQLREEAKRYIFSIYPDYKQLSALANFYTLEENTAIIDGTKALFDIAIAMKTALYAATTPEEIDAIFFRKNIAEMDEPENWVMWGQ